MREIKDYLHLYLGVECETPLGVMLLSSVDIHSEFPCWFRFKRTYDYKGVPDKNYQVLIENSLCGKGFLFKEVKPILRPLIDMNDEEIVRLFRCNHEERSHPIITNINKSQDGFLVDAKDEKMRHSMIFNLGHFGEWKPNEYLYLLSKHFDLFGLIEAGLAIEAEIIKT